MLVDSTLFQSGLLDFSEANELHLCSQEPQNYNDVIVYSLGKKENISLTLTEENAQGNTVLTISPFSDGVILAEGTATYYALVDSLSESVKIVNPLENSLECVIGHKFSLTSNTTSVEGFKLNTLDNTPLRGGINVGFLNYYSSDYPFCNRMTSCAEWLVSTSGGYDWDNSSQVPVPMRSDGYPTHVPFDAPVESGLGPQKVKTLLFRSDENYPSGDYTLIYDGVGTIKLEYDATGTFSTNGPHSITISTPTQAGVLLNIESSDVSDPVRNIRFILPGYADKYLTQTYTDEWKSLLAPFETIRFMDWGRTNRSPITNPEDLVSKEYYSQGTSRGCAIELMCTLANETQKSPWICIPHQATDATITEIANQVKLYLAPELNFYLEYSNELWNSTFSQYQYGIDKGIELGLDVDQYQALLKFQARRSGEVFQIFENVFGVESSRINKVLGTKFYSTSTPTNSLAYMADNTINPTGITPDSLAGGVYFGNYVADNLVDQGAVLTTTIDQVITLLDESLTNEIMPLITQQKALCDSYNIDLIAYEGGQHLVGTGGNLANDDLATLCINTNRDPQMATLYDKLLTFWNNAGGELFCLFLLAQYSTEFGSWGLLEYQTQGTSPKWEGTLDSLAKVINKYINNIFYSQGIDSLRAVNRVYICQSKPSSYEEVLSFGLGYLGGLNFSPLNQSSTTSGSINIVDSTEFNFIQEGTGNYVCLVDTLSSSLLGLRNLETPIEISTNSRVRVSSIKVSLTAS